MSGLESYFYFAALGIQTLFLLVVFCLPSPSGYYRVIYFTIIVVLGASIGTRWFYTQHPPIFGTFEATLAASWTLSIVSLTIDKGGRFSRLTVPFGLLILLYGLTFDATRRPLVISELSLWVYVHVLFSWLSFGLYTLCFGAALAHLSPNLGKNLTQSSSRGDELVEWLLGTGLLYAFFAQTLFFVVGAYYSSRLHGNWWVWDPVEFLFCVSWLLFAVAIHGRLFLGWQTRTVSWWVSGAFFVDIILYWGLTYFPWATYHIFDIERKTHMFIQ